MLGRPLVVLDGRGLRVVTRVHDSSKPPPKFLTKVGSSHNTTLLDSTLKRLGTIERSKNNSALPLSKVSVNEYMPMGGLIMVRVL